MKSKNKRLVIVAIVALSLLFGGAYYYEGTLPVDKNDRQPHTFVIPKGAGLNAIARDLEREGLIRNKIVFIVLVKQLGIEKNIQAGDYHLQKSLPTAEIAKRLTKGSLDRWFTVIEGLRKEEIAEQATKDLDVSSSEFLSEAQEGYLFPDTYLIPQKATAATIISIMKTNFNTKFSPEMKAKALRNGLTEKEVLTLASLVEKEALFDDDRGEIANIMLRRIKEGHKLQIDATVQYALGYQPSEKRWWKKEITFDDLEVDSPYNTYQHYGIPPGPICSPGKASIDAVVNATSDTPYLFYIHDLNGHAHYARNSVEHQRNIDKYLK